MLFICHSFLNQEAGGMLAVSGYLLLLLLAVQPVAGSTARLKAVTSTATEKWIRYPSHDKTPSSYTLLKFIEISFRTFSTLRMWHRDFGVIIVRARKAAILELGRQEFFRTNTMPESRFNLGPI
jgi:hypothetical protein